MSSLDPEPADRSSRSNEQARCRWLGATPEMLIWWIEGPCAILSYFGQAFPIPKSARAAAQCLRPLQEIEEADSKNRIANNLVYLLPDDSSQSGVPRSKPLGFFVDELSQSFGGIDSVKLNCQQCSHNTKLPFLAGCCETIVLGDANQLGQQSVKLSKEHFPLPLPEWTADFEFKTHWQKRLARELSQQLDSANEELAWYRFVTNSTWNKVQLAELDPSGLRERLLKSQNSGLSGELSLLLKAMAITHDQDLTLHFSHIPRGFSDGHDWWLGPHCFHCHAPMTTAESNCKICGNQSGAVPIQKRRVMGWAPYWPLETLIGETKTAQLIDRLTKNK